MCQQVVTSSVDRLGCYNMIARTGNVFESISDGGSTGSNCQPCYSSLKGSYAFFKNALCRVCQASVDISRILQAETCGCMSGVMEYIGSCLIDRYCTGVCCRVCLFLSYMNL